MPRQAFPLCPRKLTWTGLGGFSSYRPIGKMVCEATSPQAIVNIFHRWYRHLGFVGCSSHSDRRTFITNAARKISTVGGSLRDVQELAQVKVVFGVGAIPVSGFKRTTMTQAVEDRRF